MRISISDIITLRKKKKICNVVQIEKMSAKINFGEASLKCEIIGPHFHNDESAPIVYMKAYTIALPHSNIEQDVKFEQSIPDQPFALHIEVNNRSRQCRHRYIDIEKPIEMYWNDALCDSSIIESVYNIDPDHSLVYLMNASASGKESPPMRGTMRLCFSLNEQYSIHDGTYTVTVMFLKKISPPSLTTLSTSRIAMCLQYDEANINLLRPIYPSRLLHLIACHIRDD
jgi:hypothetical protein